ncbi:hypothetical protein [Aureimonas sp. Leaf454]|nr:hypothetical protein [Aureimonas sp. Leaf454]
MGSIPWSLGAEDHRLALSLSMGDDPGTGRGAAGIVVLVTGTW